MTFSDIWNYIVERYNKNYSAQEAVVQKEWEQYFSELFNYSLLFGEIAPHPTIHIGSTQKTIPDIIIKKDGCNLFDVELKQYNLPFSIEMENQLKSYMDLLHISIGVLICQKIYLYVYDYVEAKLKKMEIDFVKNNPDGVEFVELFQKNNFSIEKVDKFIESKKEFFANVKKIQAEISEPLISSLLEEYFKKTYTTYEIKTAIKNFNISVQEKNEITTVFHPCKTQTSPMEGADKKALSQLIKEILAEYDKQGKLIFDTKSPNSYIRFQTKEMSEFLPNMSKSGSWGHGFRYLFWLGEHETTAHKFKACFEIGGWDLDEHSIPIISKIIKLKKPGDTKLKFRYKRIYTKVYEYTPDTATQVIKYAIDDLISWQYQFLKKI